MRTEWWKDRSLLIMVNTILSAASTLASLVQVAVAIWLR